MEFSLPEFPSAPGAQAAFIAAAGVILIGLALLVFPGAIGRFLGLQGRDALPGAIGELRADGGFMLGLALATLMFDQPVLYTALGVALAVAAFARIISLMSDRAMTVRNVLVLIVQIVLAGASLYYFFDVFTPDLQLAVPEDMNARLAFYTYGAIAVVGLFMTFAPRISSAIAGLEGISDAGYSAVRSAGGFAIGAALTAMAAANPMLDLGIGAALAVAVIGRVVTLVFNRGNLAYAALALVIEAAAAALVLSYVMGMM